MHVYESFCGWGGESIKPHKLLHEVSFIFTFLDLPEVIFTNVRDVLIEKFIEIEAIFSQKV